MTHLLIGNLFYVIARPPVAVGFEEKNERRRKTWKMAVASITAIWIVDQLFTRFKLAFKIFNNFIGCLIKSDSIG